jgi:hypothetical protein
MNTPAATFWGWRDAYVPREEMGWLKADLASSMAPTIVFTHQTVDRVDSHDHNIKNSSELREIFENDGRVLAVFSGHDHRGGYADIRGIHYVTLSGNVGVSDSRSWETTSSSRGKSTEVDNQFGLVRVVKNGPESYVLRVKGYGRQPSYILDCSPR